MSIYDAHFRNIWNDESIYRNGISAVREHQYKDELLQKQREFGAALRNNFEVI